MNPDDLTWSRDDGASHTAAIARRLTDWDILTDIARGRLEGPPVDPAQGIPWLAKQLVELTVDEYDAVVAVTGKEGVSKSMGALRLVLACAAYAKERGYSSEDWSFDRLAYGARDVLHAYELARRSDAIWYDEGARGLLAGETFEPEQMALVRALMLAREKGAILVVCIPDIFALAKKVRGRRAAYWLHVDRRGTRRSPAPSHAQLFERDETLRFLPTNALGLARSKRCPEVCYEPLPVDDPTLLAYQATKRRKLDEFLRETVADLDRAEARARGERGRRGGRPQETET